LSALGERHPDLLAAVEAERAAARKKAEEARKLTSLFTKHKSAVGGGGVRDGSVDTVDVAVTRKGPPTEEAVATGFSFGFAL
jgi:hypothetical protein